MIAAAPGISARPLFHVALQAPPASSLEEARQPWRRRREALEFESLDHYRVYGSTVYGSLMGSIW